MNITENKCFMNADLKNILAITLTRHSLLWCRYRHPPLQLLLCTAHSVAQSCSTHLSPDVYGSQLSEAMNTHTVFRHTKAYSETFKVFNWSGRMKDREGIKVTPHQGLVSVVVGGNDWNGGLRLLIFSDLITGEELTQLLHTKPNKRLL